MNDRLRPPTTSAIAAACARDGYHFPHDILYKGVKPERVKADQ